MKAHPGSLLIAAAKARQQTFLERMSPAWLTQLRCIFVRGGHNYGRWFWPDRAEAHCLCEECADMRTPKNRRSWFHRERS